MNHVYQFQFQSAYDESNADGGFPVASNAQKSITVSDDSAWPVIMREFANFLSGIYGYNITEKVLLDEWYGEQSSLSDYGA